MAPWLPAKLWTELWQGLQLPKAWESSAFLEGTGMRGRTSETMITGPWRGFIMKLSEIAELS